MSSGFRESIVLCVAIQHIHTASTHYGQQALRYIIPEYRLCLVRFYSVVKVQLSISREISGHKAGLGPSVQRISLGTFTLRSFMRSGALLKRKVPEPFCRGFTRSGLALQPDVPEPLPQLPDQRLVKARNTIRCLILLPLPPLYCLAGAVTAPLDALSKAI